MHITLIGGSGFVGTRLTTRLIVAGHTVKPPIKTTEKSIPTFAQKEPPNPEGIGQPTEVPC
jgi:nucleoside-diphosphate-sugar epimerase